jgi:ComF family protein
MRFLPLHSLLFNLGTTPTECLRCKTMGSYRIANICESCYLDIARIQNSCLRCGVPLAMSTPACGKCLKNKSSVDISLIACPFISPVDDWLRNLKDRGNLSALPTLCQLMLDRICELPKQSFDLIIPMPVHWTRRCMRGFNQTELLCKSLAEALAVETSYKVLKRSRRVLSQRGLSQIERRRNQQNSFHLSDKAYPKIKGKSILLVEDIVTTGATVEQAAKILKLKGADSIAVIAVARTPEPKN